MGKNAQLKEKQKWSEEKLHLENARKLRGIYFIDPEDTEFKETIKNARKKLETSVAPAMPCKIMKNCGSGASDKNRTKLACILEANESTRMRMGNSEPHNHEDHIAGKGENSLQHYNLVHKFIPMPQAMKIPAAKAAVDKDWEKLEKISAWNLTKVKSKKQVRELIQKIENHPNRHALQRDLQQSQSFNPFSQESKQKIHEVGNIELCELLDTEPKTQCKVCLLYWDIGIVCCTCGHFLRKGTEENKKFIQYTMDLLSIPDYFKRKGDLVTGRSQETKNTTSPISSRRSAKRSTTRVSTIDLYEMTNSAGI